MHSIKYMLLFVCVIFFSGRPHKLTSRHRTLDPPAVKMTTNQQIRGVPLPPHVMWHNIPHRTITTTTTSTTEAKPVRIKWKWNILDKLFFLDDCYHLRKKGWVHTGFFVVMCSGIHDSCGTLLFILYCVRSLFDGTMPFELKVIVFLMWTISFPWNRIPFCYHYKI